MDAPSLGIIVFLRFPKPGAPVKTRLAQTVGKKRACGMYKACAEGVLGGLEELVETLGRAKVRLRSPKHLLGRALSLSARRPKQIVLGR